MNAKLGRRLPVRVLKSPMMGGPTELPACPTELIRPKVAAAADSLRIVVGIDQNAGYQANEKTPPIASKVMAIGKCALAGISSK